MDLLVGIQDLCVRLFRSKCSIMDYYYYISKIVDVLMAKSMDDEIIITST